MNRGEFLKSSVLGGLAIAVPGSGFPKGQSKTNSNAKIIDVKAYQFKKATYIRVIADTGQSGWGESDGANKKMTPFYLDEIKNYVIGKSPFDSEGIWHEVYLKGIEAGIGGLHPGTLSGIDSAIWDLKGRILGLPVHKLLGGNGLTKIRPYASYGRDKGGYNYMTPMEMAKIAEGFIEEGYIGVKARMQIRQENVNPYPDDVYECVKAVREAIGYDNKLFVDFNNGYTPAEATVVAQRLIDDFRLDALEEPVFQQDYTGLRQVVDDLKIPVMAGEHEYNKWMMKDLITVANVDIINADVIKCGGITDCRKTAAMAHAFGKQIMVHNAKPTLATAASLNLLASIPNGARLQEYAGKRLHQGYGPLFDLFYNELEFKDGHLIVPQTPGLGLEVNEKAMEKNKLNK